VNGTVEEFGRALVTLTIRANHNAEPNDGEYPLLGIGLLVGHRLVIDYTQLTVSIE